MNLQARFELFTAAWEFLKKYATAPLTSQTRTAAWAEINVLYARFDGNHDDLADAVLVGTYEEILRRIGFDEM